MEKLLNRIKLIERLTGLKTNYLEIVLIGRVGIFFPNK